MQSIQPVSDHLESVDRRTAELYLEQQNRVHVWTDRLFAWLLVFEWMIEILTALWISPYAWSGTARAVHPHVWVATLLGLAVIALPVLLAWRRPGHASTRYTIAIAQALTSAILIHLTGGRIETHFHVFGSLAVLAMYRDWKVLFWASLVVALDHAVRGIVWPQSVYGILSASPWRFAEHAGWVVVEDIFLLLACRQSLREMWNLAERQACLEASNDVISDANAQLRTEVAERQAAQRALEGARDAAEAANRAKSDFLANMSHELRTPLNAIIGFSDVLSEQVFGPLNENQQQYVSDVLDSGQHLLSLVNDILDLAKIESGAVEVGLAKVAVQPFIERAVHIFRERALRQGINLSYEVDPALESVLADERYLKQLLYNLLANAVKFTPRDGSIRVCAAHSGETVTISVADTGIGIAADEHEKIFDNFYQVDSTLTKSKQGTGLGLALVQRIAIMHGGRVWVESRVGQGSEFFVELPQSVPVEHACAV